MVKVQYAQKDKQATVSVDELPTGTAFSGKIRSFVGLFLKTPDKVVFLDVNQGLSRMKIGDTIDSGEGDKVQNYEERNITIVVND